MGLTQTVTEHVTYVGDQIVFLPQLSYPSEENSLTIIGPPIPVARHLFRTEKGEAVSFSSITKSELELEKNEYFELERKYLSVLGKKICIGKKLVKMENAQ